MKELSFAASAACALVLFTLSACSAQTVKSAPAEPAPPKTAMPYTEKLSADGLFAFGKASLDGLSAVGRAELDALATKVASRGPPTDVVHVIGHSDRIGNDKANVALSLKRAQRARLSHPARRASRQDHRGRSRQRRAGGGVRQRAQTGADRLPGAEPPRRDPGKASRLTRAARRFAGGAQHIPPALTDRSSPNINRLADTMHSHQTAKRKAYA